MIVNGMKYKKKKEKFENAFLAKSSFKKIYPVDDVSGIG
jgi:uncharacterized FAD-dependent dehydrogenase